MAQDIPPACHILGIALHEVQQGFLRQAGTDKAIRQQLAENFTPMDNFIHLVRTHSLLRRDIKLKLILHKILLDLTYGTQQQSHLILLLVVPGTYIPVQWCNSPGLIHNAPDRIILGQGQHSLQEALEFRIFLPQPDCLSYIFCQLGAQPPGRFPQIPELHEAVQE